MTHNRIRSLLSATAAALVATTLSVMAAPVVSYNTVAGATPNPGQLAPTSVDPAGGGVGPYTGEILNPPESESIRRSAWTGSGADIATSPYFAVIPNTGDPAGSPSTSATYSFTPGQTFFSLLWGSPDQENTLSFYNGAGPAVFNITGSTIITNGASSGATPNMVGVFVSFLFSGTESFDRVVLSANGRNSFEWANAAIPLPAAVWLMIAGIGGLGLVARRRKATEA